MRSSRSVLLVLLLAGCGNDTRVECSESPLTYQTFGDPYIANWCRGCHSEDLIPTMRQDAPLGVNLDTLDEVRQRRAQILEMGDRMPPTGGPSEEERALMREWLTCGAK